MRQISSRVWRYSAVMTLGIICLLSSGPVAAAARPQSFVGYKSHAGVGKHPKDAQIGVLIDENLLASQFICFGYSVTTKSKIKGRIDVDIDVMNGDGVRRLARLEKLAVRKLDLTDPNPSDNPCATPPPDAVDLDWGIVSDCQFISEDLRKGDIVRWTVKFKKASKLKGTPAVVVSLGQVIVNPASGGISLQEAENLVLKEALEGLAEGLE